MQPLDGCETLKSFLYEPDLLCPSCKKRLVHADARFSIGGKPVICAYEKNEDASRLLMRVLRDQHAPGAAIFLEESPDHRKILSRCPLRFFDYALTDKDDAAWHLFEGCRLRLADQGKYLAVLLGGARQAELEQIAFDPLCQGIWMLMCKREWMPERKNRRLFRKSDRKKI